MTLFALSKIAIQDEEVDNLYSSIKLTNQLFAGVFKSCFKSRGPCFLDLRKTNTISVKFDM